MKKYKFEIIEMRTPANFQFNTRGPTIDVVDVYDSREDAVLRVKRIREQHVNNQPEGFEPWAYHVRTVEADPDAEVALKLQQKYYRDTGKNINDSVISNIIDELIYEGYIKYNVED